MFPGSSELDCPRSISSHPAVMGGEYMRRQCGLQCLDETGSSESYGVTFTYLDSYHSHDYFINGHDSLMLIGQLFCPSCGEPIMDVHGHPVSQIMCSTIGRVLYRLGNAPIEFIVSQIGLFHVYCLSSTSSKSFRCLCTSIDDARDLIEYMGIDGFIHNVITH